MSRDLALPKHELLGIRVSATTYDDVAERIMLAAKSRGGATVDHMCVHGLIHFSRDPSLRTVLNSFDVVAPDGQPVRWALRWLRGVRLPDRVYGPELMRRLCARAAQEDVGIYLYGSTPEVLKGLCANLRRDYPKLRIVGSESPPYRPLTPAEDRAVIERINGSGAGIVFLGLGCPKQEQFAYEHRNSICAVQMCVGAAFDFIAGFKRVAPRWMQDRGLEWLFRLLSEPRRLWRRYLLNNTRFVLRVGGELLRRRLRPGASES